jgi:tetratricopeptide (TPR) repeat protein
VARAAVKAKQQAKAKPQPTKPARRRRRRGHAGGGNPNQQLFFVRLRRGQKWLYALLAIVFAATFAGVGVGSGNNGGLSQLYSGLFGSGSDPVSKAQGEIKKNPVKGYQDLAQAYETKSDFPQAITALQSLVALKKKDANAWIDLGNLQSSEANTYIQQYQSAQQSAATADPSQPFLPNGTLAQALGSNAAFQGAQQQAQSQTSLLYQQATTALAAAVTDYQKVTKLQPKNPTGWQLLAGAAQQNGKNPLAIHSWRTFLKLSPGTTDRAQIEKVIKQLTKAEAASKTTPKVSTNNSKHHKK